MDRVYDLDELLKESGEFHGHICAGQVLGVRMAIVGLESIGITDPKGEQRKDHIVYVEIDRCATDAIMSVSGCKPGKRTMKIFDYGKMAATFVNIVTNRAVRVTALESSRAKAQAYFPEMEKDKAQLEGYKVMPDADLFDVKEVSVRFRPEDLPGKPLRKIICAACGEPVMDGRDVKKNGMDLCKPCADGKDYYERKA